MHSIEINGLNKIGNYAGKSLLSLMTELKEIQSLKLIDIEFTDADVKYINQALEVDNSLTQVYFNGSYFSADYINQFLESFRFCNTTKILNLERLGVKEDNAEVLLNALTNIHELNELNLSNNAINSGVIHIGKVLSSNKNLVKLTLNNCYINDKSFSGLQDVLSLNSTLLFLDLCINSITDISGDTLKCLLEENKSIKTLYLLQNKIRLISCKSKLPPSEIYRVVMEY